MLGRVESGAAEHGFVYRTDARRARRAHTLWTAAPDEPPFVRYWVQAARGAPPAATELVAWLSTGGADAAAAALGFEPLAG